MDPDSNTPRSMAKDEYRVRTTIENQIRKEQGVIPRAEPRKI